jgi:DNA-binding HxlR family transcriptional regulator
MSYTLVVNRSVCSRFHRAVELIGGRWSGPILLAVLAGRHRYADIRASIPGLSDTMLAQRLRALEGEGLIERRVLPTSPVRVEYHPTPKGEDLVPVLEAVAAWAEQWIDVESGTQEEPEPGTEASA